MDNHGDTTDRVLGIRIKASDHAAFKVLFYRYYDPLFRFVSRRLSNQAGASDIVQDVFVRVWQNRARLDPDQPLKAYLFRIANNMLIDQYRKRDVRLAYAAQQDTTPPMVAPVEHFDVEEEVMAAINRLPEAIRQTFILSRFEAMTYPEIAALLEVSVKTVESRMSKALKKLRVTLQHMLVLALIAWLMKGGS